MTRRETGREGMGCQFDQNTFYAYMKLPNNKNGFRPLYLGFYIYEHIAYKYGCAPCVPGPHGCHRMASDPLEQALWMVMNHHMDAGNHP